MLAAVLAWATFVGPAEGPSAPGDSMVEPDAGRQPRVEPNYDPFLEYSREPKGRGFRGLSFGFGARGVFMPGSCCSFSPIADVMAEFGSRHARFVVGLYSAPLPILDVDVVIFNVLSARVGALFGNENIRGGFTAGGGFLWFGADGHLMITPWRTCQGHRHGVELSAGWGWVYGAVATIGYRFAPGGPNHRGGRSAGLARAHRLRHKKCP